MTQLSSSLFRLLPGGRRSLYQNPVQAGDFPDPSVIRCGERDYFATTTSTDWAPQFPIFHSRDLISWTLVGAVFDSRPAWSTGSFWAPEFAEFDGRFYVYYVARMSAGPLCVAVASADHPAGPYVDHGPLVGQNDGSIDPMATVDEFGQRWLIWKEDGNSGKRPTPIWAQRLTVDGLSLVGAKHELIRNDAAWEGHVVEAPAIFRRGDYFYLLYSGNACCGADCAYAVGVARSASLFGPWEKFSGNPILTGNDRFRCPGHGSVTTDESGRMFFLYHAYAVGADCVYVGRQMLLDRIDWTADGWPTINNGEGPSAVASTPFAHTRIHKAQTFHDEFKGPVLSHGWQWPQGKRPDAALERRRGGRLVLNTSPGEGECDLLDAVIGRPVASGNFVATTALDVRDVAPGAIASLTAYGDRRNALGVAVQNRRVVLWRRKAGKITIVTTIAQRMTATTYLRMTVTAGHNYKLAFSRDGKHWETLPGTANGAHLPPWDSGVRVALTVGGMRGATARFAFLRIRALATYESAAELRGQFERHRVRLRRVGSRAPGSVA